MNVTIIMLGAICVETGLWMPVAWCFNTRSSVTILTNIWKFIIIDRYSCSEKSSTRVMVLKHIHWGFVWTKWPLNSIVFSFHYTEVALFNMAQCFLVHFQSRRKTEERGIVSLVSTKSCDLFKSTYVPLNLRAQEFSYLNRFTSFNVWVRYFVWNVKGYL